jgi:hypothetical protein
MMIDLIGRVLKILEEVETVEHHLHNAERWWGAVGVPDETNAIAATVTVPFAATSGNNTWGAAIPILGTGDSPVTSISTTFDPHRILITGLDDETDAWRLRLIWGSSDSATAIAAGQWSEVMLQSNAVPGNRAGGQPVDIIMPILTVGIKMWAQVWNDTNGEVLSFFWGAHGYPPVTE